jgi:hypothetical protein
MGSMPDIAESWTSVLPQIRDNVTGVGVWSALNAARVIAFEDGVLVLGVPHKDHELAGHLNLPATRKAIEEAMSGALEAQLAVRVIQGVSPEDWASIKEGDRIKRQLQERALDRARSELSAGQSWEGLYEKLSRRFAEIEQRSLPQNRARFFIEAVDIVADALIEKPVTDDMDERNFARCIERIAQYTEIPGALVAARVLEKAFER